MAWGKVDDKLHSSPKWGAATKPARALWTTALSWSMDQLTDGHIPRHMLPRLDGTKAEAACLVTVGLWTEVEDGWQFHDWHDYQPTRDQVLAERAASTERVKRWRESKRNAVSNGISNAVTPTVGNAVGNASPSPSRPNSFKSSSSSYSKTPPDEPDPDPTRPTDDDLMPIALEETRRRNNVTDPHPYARGMLRDPDTRTRLTDEWHRRQAEAAQVERTRNCPTCHGQGLAGQLPNGTPTTINNPDSQASGPCPTCTTPVMSRERVGNNPQPITDA